MDRNRQQRDDDQWMTDGPGPEAETADVPSRADHADPAAAESGTGVDPDLAGIEPDVGPDSGAPASDTLDHDPETGVPLL